MKKLMLMTLVMIMGCTNETRQPPPDDETTSTVEQGHKRDAAIDSPPTVDAYGPEAVRW